MSDLPNATPRFLTRFSLDSWAVSLATALLVLIVLGVLPRIPW